MDVLRTPDERFENLAGFSYEPMYVEVEGLRIHYVDAGPSDAPVVLLMHGEPSWSYLYRTMIPVLTGSGYRAIAPDLIGFGRSDKLARREDYSYQRHVDWMHGFVDALDLRAVTLFAQDWGGLIGLRVVAEQPDRFARVAVGNTGLPTGDRPPTEAFLAWRRYSQESPHFHVGGIVKGGCVRDVEAEVVAAYDAPFPDDRYTTGPRAFPVLVPISPDDPASEPNRAAWKVLQTWEKPFLTLFSDSDPITRGGERVFHKLVPGCQGQPHRTIEGAGHFLQEDEGPEIARALASWIG